jgi:hypothetical protein
MMKNEGALARGRRDYHDEYVREKGRRLMAKRRSVFNWEERRGYRFLRARNAHTQAEVFRWS